MLQTLYKVDVTGAPQKLRQKNFNCSLVTILVLPSVNTVLLAKVTETKIQKDAYNLNYNKIQRRDVCGVSNRSCRSTVS